MRIEQFNALRTTIATRSGPLAYADTGAPPGGGPVALFVHGVGTNAYLWRHVMAALRDECRCVAIDLPLHGMSPAAPDQDFSLGALAQTLEDFCDALGLAEADLVANDTGGAIAQIFAARHPERLRTFTLTNCDVHDNLPPEAFAPTVELAAAGALAEGGPALAADPAALRATAYAEVFERPERVADETLRHYAEPVLGTGDNARLFERCLTSLVPDDLLAAEPALAALEVPTLIVWGTGDVFFEVRWAYWLRETIAGAERVVEVPGARLFFPDERPGDLVPHLREHWGLKPRG